MAGRHFQIGSVWKRVGKLVKNSRGEYSFACVHQQHGQLESRSNLEHIDAAGGFEDARFNSGWAFQRDLPIFQISEPLVEIEFERSGQPSIEHWLAEPGFADRVP